MDRLQRAKENIIWGVLSKIGVLFLPFIVRTILIKTLGTEYVGLGTLFTSILQVLSLAELGVDGAIVFSMYEPLARDDQKTICALLNLYRTVYRIIGLAILIVGMVLMPFLKHFIKGGYPPDINVYLIYLIYLANTVISYVGFAYGNAVLRACQRDDINSKYVLVLSTVLNVIQILVLCLSKNYYIYAIFFPLYNFLSNYIRAKATRKLYPQYFCQGKLDGNEIKHIKKRIMGMLINKICGVCRTSFDSIIISAFIGLLTVVKYQNYYMILNMLFEFTGIINSSIKHGIGNSLITEKAEKNYSDFKTFIFIMLWLSGWCSICLLCLYQPFITIWVGADYLFPIEIVILFCVYFYVLKVNDIIFVYREAAGLWWEDRYRPLLESIFNLAMNIFLVKKYGIGGVLLSTIISIVLISLPWSTIILHEKCFKRRAGYFGKEVLKASFVTGVIAFNTYQICGLVHGSGYGSFIIRGIVCIVLPNIIYLVVYMRKKEFRNTVNLLKNMIKRET